MIRVTIDLNVVSESEDAYWLSDCPLSVYRQHLKTTGGDHAATRVELRSREESHRLDEYQFIRVPKDTSTAETVENRIGFLCDVSQVVKWPHAIDLEAEVSRCCTNAPL